MSHFRLFYHVPSVIIRDLTEFAFFCIDNGGVRKKEDTICNPHTQNGVSLKW